VGQWGTEKRLQLCTNRPVEGVNKRQLPRHKLVQTHPALIRPPLCDRHLDADEAVVLGAGLYAANLSTTFRLRKFGMSDGVTYPVAFQVPKGVA
jgi:hypothetical protein